MKPYQKLTALPLLSLLLMITLNSCEKRDPTTVTIGIIEPLEHTAMTEIVAGYTETLHKLYNKPIIVKVENAQNDPNIERAIIQKMRDTGDTLIVPIGVDATEMTLAMTHNQPVVSLASDISNNHRLTLKNCRVAVVHDEIPVNQLIAFIHAAYPQLTQLTLIHSSANKVLPEVDQTIAAGKQYGIMINHIMVSSLPELYSAANALPANTQGIFVLKDSLIVSGISTLSKTAANKKIPLITSDQGSIQNGAGFALGVHEREIGVQGAILSAAILKGKSPCELPIIDMKNLTIFINKKSLQDENQSIENLIKSAKQFNYKTEIIDTNIDETI